MFSVLSNKDFSFLQKMRWLRLLIRTGFDRRFDKLVSLIFELIPNDRPIVIDVGANVGNFTRSCVKQKKKTSLIIAVEPSHYVFPILELWSKFWASKDSKIVCKKNILSDNKGISKLHTPIKDTGSLRVGLAYVGQQKHDNVYSESVEVRKLDELLLEQGISSVDLVKVDVEGAEENVINGASKLINEIKPYWYLELDDSRAKVMGNSSKRVFKRMIDAGYDAYFLDKNLKPVKVDTLHGEDNYLFVPKKYSTRFLKYI